LYGVRGITFARCLHRAATREVERIRTDAQGGKYVPHHGLALILAALGDSDAALTELERAFDDREWPTFSIGAEPALRTLTSHPRFVRLIQRLRFPS
jgi:hypothetical protein